MYCIYYIHKIFPILSIFSDKVFPFLDMDSADETGRLLNSKKVSDHHAIIPTLEIQKSDLTSCAAEEMNVLILIAARMICAAGKRHIYETVRANLQCCDYTFTAVGKSVTIPGWKAVEEAMKKQRLAIKNIRFFLNFID